MAEFYIAEAQQQEDQPEFPLLYALQGFRYCDLLVSLGQFQEAQTRATQMLEWGKMYGGLLTTALDQLALGRVHLGLAQRIDAAAPHLTQTADWLRLAVDGLRQAGDQTRLPLGLLARAEWARVAKQFDQARRDLAEAFTIAERGEMRLHLADCYLEFARLSLATGDRDSARKAWETAKVMIEEMGYHRRDGEVAEIEAQL